MLEGLYKVEFSTPIGSGEGLIHAVSGKIGGGDYILFYTGTYQQEGNTFTATIHTGRHASVAGMTSVFGKDQVTINLTGTLTDTGATCVGTSPDAPGKNFNAKLKKLAA